MTAPSTRLDLVDALRGFAIVSIMLLHNIEHFNLYYSAEGIPAWMATIDKYLWDAGFWLFGGKSYAIFALLFGVTFHIQMQSRQNKGEDFRMRFAWRMVLLFMFGMVNTLFYDGDILSFYAVLGLTLIPVSRLSNRHLVMMAIFLSLQPWQWMLAGEAMTQPARTLPNPASWAYFGNATEYLTKGSMLDAWWGNLTNGKAGAVLWSWENGRVLQIPALFMAGMVLARTGRFEINQANRSFWLRTMVIALALLLPLAWVNAHIGGWIGNEALRRPIKTIIQAWVNLAAMPILASVFVLAYHSGWLKSVFKLLSPLGRMSLTSYVMQSIAGSFIYYGFGLGLYRYTGSTYCLMIGLGLAGMQIAFSIWWLKHHKQGPLESLWHRLTWLGTARTTQAVVGAAK